MVCFFPAVIFFYNFRNDVLPEVPPELHLYLLEDVPFMIKAFAKPPHGDPQPEVIMAFNRLITSFDPDDPEWRS